MYASSSHFCAAFSSRTLISRTARMRAEIQAMFGIERNAPRGKISLSEDVAEFTEARRRLEEDRDRP